MANAESVSHDDLVVCSVRGQDFTVRDTIEAALFRGELQPIWQSFLKTIAAEKQADDGKFELDDDAIDAGAERFRYGHDLITAEETEQWLNTRGLTLDDFGNYFARQVAAETAGDGAVPEAIDYRSASDDLRQLFIVDLILSDQLEKV